MATKISNCGHDESGKYSGGKAGDQTGGEWEIRSWYNRPWDVMLRHPDAKVQALIAKYAKQAANNDHIGYDQSQRTTFWTQLKAVQNYAPKNITKDCETDCSAGVLSIVKAVGYKKKNTKLKNVDVNGYTGNMASILKKAGFKAYTDAKHRTTSDYLLPGDILVNESHHTAINVTEGSKAKVKAKAITNELVQAVIDGEYGNGDEREKNLIAAGYDPAAVQEAVNKMC